MVGICALLTVACSPQVTPVEPLSPKPVTTVSVVQQTIPYQRDIQSAAEFYFGVPAPSPVIAGQIAQESNFDPNAKSPVGALGLLQFMPATAKWAGEAGGFGVASPLDPAWSIRAGAWYDRFLYDRVKVANTPCDRWLFALSAYNGGEKWRQVRQSKSPDPGSWAVTGTINPGISESSQRENERYGPRILFVHQPRFALMGPIVCKGGV